MNFSSNRKLPPSLQHRQCRLPLLQQPLPPPTPLFCRGHSLQMVATPSSVIVTADYAANIVSLSHTHQVISLKLKNTNYLYWRMQMKPYLLGKEFSSLLMVQTLVCKTSERKIINWLVSCTTKEFVTLDWVIKKFTWNILILFLSLCKNFRIFGEIQKFEKNYNLTSFMLLDVIFNPTIRLSWNFMRNLKIYWIKSS